MSSLVAIEPVPLRPGHVGLAPVGQLLLARGLRYAGIGPDLGVAGHRGETERTMNRWYFPLARLGLVVAVLAADVGAAPGQDGVGADKAPAWDASARADLIRYARATWHSFEAMTGADGLPADGLDEGDDGRWEPSARTSPTNMGAYLWSTLAARALGLIDEAGADRRIGATLDSLGVLDREHGFFFNLYDVATRASQGVGGDPTHPARPFLSSVDNGWLAAGLTMVRNTRPALRERADALLAPMDFGFFYEPFDPADPVRHAGQFHGGSYTDDRSFTATYGMLNTEPRIVSYLAITRGQVPPEHYYRLFRTYPTGRGPQTQVPQGEVRPYLGVPVFEGHYDVRGRRIVPSWGGSMFEALMVPLFVPEETWAPASWGINHPLYARAQVEEGMDVKHYGFWGFSPASKPEGGYQNYGVPDLGTEVTGYWTAEAPPARNKEGKPVGHTANGVVTPHASFLALRYAPREALANLRALERAFPIFGAEGFPRLGEHDHRHRQPVGPRARPGDDPGGACQRPGRRRPPPRPRRWADRGGDPPPDRPRSVHRRRPPRRSGPAVGRVAERAQKERDVMMRPRVDDLEVDHDPGVESEHAPTFEVGPGGEVEPVNARRERVVAGQEVADPAVGVGRGVAQVVPAVARLESQGDADARGGAAGALVEDVGGDRAGHRTSFSRRRRMILACSAAAMVASVAESLGRRAWRRASISAALLPVAQTMKMWPNLAS